MAMNLVLDMGRSSNQTDQAEPSLVKATSTTAFNAGLIRTMRLRRVERSTVSADDHEDSSDAANVSVPMERLYPHTFDEQGQAGEVLMLVQSALTDVRLALVEFGAADFRSISTRLIQVAASMKKAHSNTHFNESFGAVVSFIRRAMLSAVVEDISRPALNALLSSLQFLKSNPMLGLDEASDLIERLSTEGWKGNHSVTEEIITALLCDSEASYEEIQKMLFPIES